MIDYQTTIPFTIGAFPNTVGQNATGPGATDGTPWLKSVIDDLWGARQVLMDESNQVPNALTESVANGSQAYEAIRRIAGYAGEVIFWAGQDNADGTFSDPSSEDIRMIELTGQGVLIANYPELDRVVYCGDAANPTAQSFYHSSDSGGAVRNVAGPYLQLPEGRGVIARGFDPNSTYSDPYFLETSNARQIGSVQLSAVYAHCHQTEHLWDAGPPENWNGIVFTADLIYNNIDDPFDYFGSTADPANTEVYARTMEQTYCDYTFVSSEYESRMTNLAFRLCIRY